LKGNTNYLPLIFLGSRCWS